MKHPLPLLCCALLLLAGCSGDDGESPPRPPVTVPSELVGDWVAGSACASAGCAVTVYSPADSFSVTSYVSVYMKIQSQGDYQLEIVAPGTDTTRTGTVHASNGSMVVTYGDGTADTLSYAFTDPLLRVDDPREVTLLDVDGDGVPDPLRVRLIFAPR